MPPEPAYCRSSLVRRPLRAKYCATSGFVVFRFDHYCGTAAAVCILMYD